LCFPGAREWFGQEYRNEDQQEKQSPGEVKGNEHASGHQTAEVVNGIADPGIDAMCNQRASLGSYGEGTADLVTRDEKDDGGKECDQETDCTRGVPGPGRNAVTRRTTSTTPN